VLLAQPRHQQHHNPQPQPPKPAHETLMAGAEPRWRARLRSKRTGGSPEPFPVASSPAAALQPRKSRWGPSVPIPAPPSESKAFSATACILAVPGRAYPVDVQYATEPIADFLRASADAALLVHRLEPPGDVLVFVPGAEEVSVVCHLIRDAAPGAQLQPSSRPRQDTHQHRQGSTAGFAARAAQAHQRGRGPRGGTFDGFAETTATALSGEYAAGTELDVCPLHAKLPWQDQLRALRPGRMLRGGRRTRKVIVATSVAETSITLPGVTVVIDCGFTRRPAYDPVSGLTGLVTRPVSMAQAVQRAGRAGRVRPGKCLRLYTESTLLGLDAATPAEIRCAPLTPLVMQLLGLGVRSLHKFRFLEPPPVAAMERALGELASLRAVEAVAGTGPSAGVKLSLTGRMLCRLPVQPHHAAILLASLTPALHCAQEALSLVAMLSAGDPVLPKSAAKRQAAASASAAASSAEATDGSGESIGGSFHRFLASEGDHLTLVNMFNAWAANGKSEAWCAEYGLRSAVLRRASETRAVLERALKAARAMHTASTTRDPELMDVDCSCGSFGQLLLRAVVGGAPLQLARLGRGGAYVTLQGSRSVSMRDTAVLSRITGDASVPAWVAFDGMMVVPEGKLVISACSAVDPRWALEAAPDLLSLRETDPTRRHLSASTARSAAAMDGNGYTERELDDGALNRAVAGILGAQCGEEEEGSLQQELQMASQRSMATTGASAAASSSLAGVDKTSRFHSKRLRQAPLRERVPVIPASVASMALPLRGPRRSGVAPDRQGGSAAVANRRGGAKQVQVAVSFDDDDDDD
jgi:HrpA-like RNA helicase